MVEYAVLEDGLVRAAQGRTLTAGENIVPRGREARSGAELLHAGTVLGPAEIALAASCGRATRPVRRRPLVAIAATGDELVELDRTPEPHQIRNSNSYGLAALVAEAGGRPGRLEIARDTREEIRERVAQGRMWNLMLLSGGVSAGKYDLVEEVLAEFGAEFFFTGVAMQPGRPLVFGRLPARQHPPQGTPEPECYFFGLPGNPISTQVTFHCFVEPLLRVLAGGEWTGPRFAQATLAEDVAAKTGLTRVLPAVIAPGLERTEVRLERWQGSGDLAANARANGYVVLPDGAALKAGDIVTVLLR
jgi:molybdopterin molybdotransferase